jgi:hypothetical protein
MNINFKFKGSITSQDSLRLDELATLIERDCDLPVQQDKKAT